MTYDEPKWFQKNSCLSTIFDHSDSYKNYPDKKNVWRKRFGGSLKLTRQCMNFKNDDSA